MSSRWMLALMIFAGFAAVRPTLAQTSEAARLFDAANDQFLSGQYAEALTSYQEVLESGYVSGALYHNMGSTFFRLDEIGQAIRHYEKARRMIGDDPQLLHNIQIVEGLIGSPFSVLPEPFWRTWWNAWFAMRNPWWMMAAGMVLYCVGIALYAHRIWTQVRNDWLRRLRAVVLVIGCTLLLTAVTISADQAASNRAAIIVPEVQLSSTDGGITVPEGIIVTIVSRAENGVEVQLPNGVRGIVEEDVLGEI